MAEENPQRAVEAAAAYVRMSTEHQQYSTNNQLDVIREYAARRGLVISKVYSDEGKSGLKMEGRDSLAAMISDVENGSAAFKAILVYDVSRWGRFQEADERLLRIHLPTRRNFSALLRGAVRERRKSGIYDRKRGYSR